MSSAALGRGLRALSSVPRARPLLRLRVPTDGEASIRPPRFGLNLGFGRLRYFRAKSFPGPKIKAEAEADGGAARVWLPGTLTCRPAWGCDSRQSAGLGMDSRSAIKAAKFMPFVRHGSARNDRPLLLVSKPSCVLTIAWAHNLGLSPPFRDSFWAA